MSALSQSVAPSTRRSAPACPVSCSASCRHWHRLSPIPGPPEGHATRLRPRQPTRPSTARVGAEQDRPSLPAHLVHVVPEGRRAVVFPAPLGPRNPCTSPRSTCRSRPARALVLPNLFDGLVRVDGDVTDGSGLSGHDSYASVATSGGGPSTRVRLPGTPASSATARPPRARSPTRAAAARGRTGHRRARRSAGPRASGPVAVRSPVSPRRSATA